MQWSLSQNHFRTYFRTHLEESSQGYVSAVRSHAAHTVLRPWHVPMGFVMAGYPPAKYHQLSKNLGVPTLFSRSSAAIAVVVFYGYEPPCMSLSVLGWERGSSLTSKSDTYPSRNLYSGCGWQTARPFLTRVKNIILGC